MAKNPPGFKIPDSTDKGKAKYMFWFVSSLGRPGQPVLAQGLAIGKSLAARKLFPPMMIHLISSGESSGELEKMLERAASNQER